MSVEVASAYVTLIPSARGFQSKLQRELSGPSATEGQRAGGIAGQRFSQSFSSRVGSAGRRLFAPLARAAFTFTAGLTAAGGAAVVFGLKTAASLEQAQVAFTTMLGSAKRAHAFLDRLRQFAIKTPFEFADVTRASQRLLAFGFRAKQVLPTLTAVGDAAAGLGLGAEGIDRITTAIGQIQAKGKVQSDELLQLTESGVPALRILAAGFGKTTARMQEMVTKGLVPADKAIPILIRGLEKGTKTTAKFGGLMDKQSRTLGGLWSTFKDTVTTGLASAVQPLVPIIERLLPGAMDFLSGAFDRTAAGARVFIRVLQGADGPSRGFLGRVADVATLLRDRFIPAVVGIAREAAPALGDFITNAARLGRELWPAIQPVLKLAGGVALNGLRTASDLMGTLADHATTAQAALAIVAGLFVKKKLSGLGRGLSGLLGGKNGGLLDKGGSPARPLYVWVVNGGAGGGGLVGLPGGKGGKGGRLGKLGRFGKFGLGLLGPLGEGALIAELLGNGPSKAFHLGGAKASQEKAQELFVDKYLTYNLQQRKAIDRLAPAAMSALKTGDVARLDDVIARAQTAVRKYGGTAKSTLHALNNLLIDNLGLTEKAINKAIVLHAEYAKPFQIKLNIAQTVKHQRFDALADVGGSMPRYRAPAVQGPYAQQKAPSITVRGNIIVQGVTAPELLLGITRKSRVRALSGTSDVPHGA